MALTSDEIKVELRKLGKRDGEIMRLLHPEWKPIKDYPNITIAFPGFEDWLNEQPIPLQRSMRAAVQRFLIAQADHRRRTLDQLALIAKRSTGRAVLAEIRTARSRKLKIMPVAGGEHNAFSDALSARKSTRLGFRVRYADGTEVPGLRRGTGEGSHATVEFTANMWGPSGSARATGPGSLPDEVLCHELVHAGRQMQGIQHSATVDKGYENEEEFVAIVVSNVYLSEKKQTRMRGTHRFKDRVVRGRVVGMEFDVLPNPERFLDNPQGMHPPPFQMMEKIRTAQRSLHDALCDIGTGVAKFNPSRDWEAKRAKVFIDL